MQKLLDTLKNFPYGATIEQLEAICWTGEATASLLVDLVKAGTVRWDGKLFYPVECK